MKYIVLSENSSHRNTHSGPEIITFSDWLNSLSWLTNILTYTYVIATKRSNRENSIFWEFSADFVMETNGFIDVSGTVNTPTCGLGCKGSKFKVPPLFSIRIFKKNNSDLWCIANKFWNV